MTTKVLKMVSGSLYIAGSKTADDWKLFRKSLVVGESPHNWEAAFYDYFHARLHSRYLKPIEILQSNGTFTGEGFSIVAIQCTLVEFLASAREGKSYRFRTRKDPPLILSREYDKSSKNFADFLSSQPPFNRDFSLSLARDFYVSVRCALLHEARTRDGWTIWARAPSGKAVVDGKGKVVYRDDLQDAILEYVESYGAALRREADLQQAFIRKFDDLAA